MNKPGYEEEKWHTCHPLSVAENSQENQDDWIFRRDRSFERIGIFLLKILRSALSFHMLYYVIVKEDKVNLPHFLVAFINHA
jgi:hypothetical protein